MDFKDFKIIPNLDTGKKKLFLSTEEKIEICEDNLKFNFDADYKEYVLTYGNGILGGTYIRIYLPEKIQKIQAAWRERIDEYWFWEKGKDVLTKKEVLKSIIIGDTFDGDEIIFYKNSYFIISINDETIYNPADTLEETIHWLCNSGILTEAFSEREFEPFEENF